MVPVYNERYLVEACLRRVLAVAVPGIEQVEIVVVDDGSTDGTGAILDRLAAEWPERIRLLRQTNGGKGSALSAGIAAATGDFILFQDADLEYDPRDIPALVAPLLEDAADAVYGSRFLAAGRRRVLPHRHAMGNRLLTAISNWCTDLGLTDMETCYKAVKAPLLKSIPIRSRRFGVEPELTAKLAKRRAALFEVPISYLGRTYQEGKKIGWRDGFDAVWTMLKYWLVDDVYREDAYGSQILGSLERARRFNGWMAAAVRPHVGDRVLEIGAGIGNLTMQLVPRDRYLATDLEPLYVDYLATLARGRPYLEARRLDATDEAGFRDLAGGFDTVVCLNVLEHVPDPAAALANVVSALAPGGRLVLYVPAGPGLFSSLDEVLEHRCRYTRDGLEKELRAAGLEIESVRGFNKVGVLGWVLNGLLLRRRKFGRVQLKLYDLGVPLWRRLDGVLPWPGLGLLAVARKPAPAAPNR
ncbi:MAG TPA: glycosyltransferase [Thermoanaerobaculia bacterium]|nr:glycosyltransferase [Thermoanaerobaculia bacterium]